MNTCIKKLFSAVILFLAYSFTLGVSAQDLTVKFMLDTSGAMQEQDIVSSSSSILAAEISDFTRNSSLVRKDSSVRILVDSFWQKDDSIHTHGIFDYRLGQSGMPNYEGLRELKTKWFVNVETTLNKFVNRNLPAETPNTIWVILTNSQETLEEGEIIAINKKAQKVNSKLIIVTLPRKNSYGETALKAAIAQKIHDAVAEVKSHIISLQFKMMVKISVNGKEIDPDNTITKAAPVKIEMNAIVSGESKFFWVCKDTEKKGKNIILNIENADDFIVTAVGVDSMGNKHLQEIKFNILPVPQAVAEFSYFPKSGVAPLNVSTINKSINAKKYQWNWGDGTTESYEQEPTHTYQHPGEYTITLNILGENEDTVSKKSKVSVSYPAPLAKFDIPTDISTDSFAEFSNKSQNATRWNWNFGDGKTSTENNPKHKFAKPGQYKVVLQAFNPDNISSKCEKTIEVKEKFDARFEWQMSSEQAPYSVTFKNTSTGAVKYHWDFGDGKTSTDANPTHKFATQETKIFSVSLTAITENGRELTTTERITIAINQAGILPLTANFSYAQQMNAAVPTIKFTNTSTGGEKYHWDFGDGKTSTETNPTHVYNTQDTPLVNVALVVTSANGREAKKVLSVKIIQPSPGSSFGIILVIILVIAAGGIAAAIKFLKTRKTFAVTLFSKENKPVGKKDVKIGEIVPITALNGGSDLDFQIFKAEDDSGDDFKVRFRKPEESPAVVKQKTLKIHLNDQWCDAIDMANITVDSCRLIFSDTNEEEGENENE